MEEQPWDKIKTEKLTSACKKIANWKAPGLDQVQNFWLKYLVALHPILAKLIDHIIIEPEDETEWMNVGPTVIIHKKGPTNITKNYCPITCLPTYYKLLTLIFTDLVYDHVTTNEILPLEQKGIRRKSRGCKDQLLLGRAITEDARKRRNNLIVMWISYKKPYDSVPHSWLIAVLKLYKINTHIINFITHTMKKWRTRIFIPHKNSCIESTYITFRRGIFQGDTFSPLFF